MSVDEGFPIWALTIYEATKGDQDNVFNMDLHGDTIDNGPKLIEELVKLQLEPKPGQCT